MENLFIKETTSTPEISFNAKQGFLQIKGVSLPEDTESFYQQLFDFLSNNTNEIRKKRLTVALMFLYLNTASSAIVSRLLQLLEKIDSGKNIVTIKWYHEEEDDDMKDIGLDFNAVTSTKFELVSVDEI